MYLKLAITIITSIVLAGCAANPKEVDKNATPPSIGDVKLVRIKLPIYEHVISFNLPSTWKAVFENNTAESYIVEFVHSDESADQWSNMFTVQGLKGLDSSYTPERFIQVLALQHQNTCGENLVFSKIESGEIGGYPVSTSVIGCANNPEDHASGLKKGQTESAVFYVIRGKESLFVISNALRENNPKSSLNNENVRNIMKSIVPIQID